MLYRGSFIAALVLTVSAVSAAPEWKLLSLEATKHEVLVEPVGEYHRGQPIVYDKQLKPAAGHIFLALTFNASIDFTPTSGDLAVPAEQVKVIADGKDVVIRGRSVGPGTVQVEKTMRFGWAKDPFLKTAQTKEIKQIWFVEAPADAKQVTLKLGDKEASAAIPAEVTKIDPAEAIDFQVKNVQVADKFNSLMAPPDKQLMKVSIVLKPKRESHKDEQGKPWFSFSTTSLNIRTGDKTAAVVGYLINADVIKPGSYSLGVPYSANSQFPIEPIFEVPAGTKSGTLLWYGWPAGDIK